MICYARFVFSGVKEKGMLDCFRESRDASMSLIAAFVPPTLMTESSMDWAGGEAATAFQGQLASSSQQASLKERHDHVRFGCRQWRLMSIKMN